jgi:hypothetical protein
MFTRIIVGDNERVLPARNKRFPEIRAGAPQRPEPGGNGGEAGASQPDPAARRGFFLTSATSCYIM